MTFTFSSTSIIFLASSAISRVNMLGPSSSNTTPSILKFPSSSQLPTYLSVPLLNVASQLGSTIPTTVNVSVPTSTGYCKSTNSGGVQSVSYTHLDWFAKVPTHIDSNPSPG